MYTEGLWQGCIQMNLNTVLPRGVNHVLVNYAFVNHVLVNYPFVNYNSIEHTYILS